MNPVKGITMLDFLEWLKEIHPEIDELKDLSEEQLIILIYEFEGNNSSINEILKQKWLSGFNFLLNTTSDWNGYTEARKYYISNYKNNKNKLNSLIKEFKSWYLDKYNPEERTHLGRIEILFNRFLETKDISRELQYIFVNQLRENELFKKLFRENIK